MKTLFEIPRSHRNDPVTSYIAAEKLAKSGRAQSQRDAVLSALKVHNGATSAELGAYMGRDRYMPARRLPELEEAGLIIQGPARACRVLSPLRNRPVRCVTWFLAETFGPLNLEEKIE